MTAESQQWIKSVLGITYIESIDQMPSAKFNQVHELVTPKGVYFHKRGPNLEDEYVRLNWLKDKLPVPQAVAWRKAEGDQQELITSGIKGKDLSEIANTVPRADLIHWLVEIHKTIAAVNIDDCPFGEQLPGYIFTHGDACLPNFIFDNDRLAGIIDVHKAGIAEPETDIAATVWSLCVNCDDQTALDFLHLLGHTDATENDIARLVRKYEPEWSD